MKPNIFIRACPNVTGLNVIASAAWQSQPFFMRLLRPFGARNDTGGIFFAPRDDMVIGNAPYFIPSLWDNAIYFGTMLFIKEGKNECIYF